MWRRVLILSLLAVAVQSATRRDAGVAVGFRPNCHPKPMGGCKCDITEGDLNTEIEFDNNEDCKKPLESALNLRLCRTIASQSRPVAANATSIWGMVKKSLNIRLMHNARRASKTAEHKKELNEEIKDKFGDFKENCFPKPSGGCKCNEKDAQGNEVVTAYNNAEECKISRVKRDVGVATQRQPSSVHQTHQKARARDQPSQNVRDPIRERAQANYAAVLDELHNKFKGLKEGCFPRPKGRDITERRMKDADCKCKEGERGHGCPAA
ncbi:hypothetical protein OSTOST_09725 [Ostertagia ostertagi]